MSRTLILNATYEPLCVVPLRRAIILVLAEKAEVVATADGEMRSAHLSVPMPDVIRLKRFVRIPYRRRVPLTRKGVLARDGFACGYCSKTADTIDHIVPRAKGGKHEWLNVVAACKKCNSAKRDRTLVQANMELRLKPFEPAGTTALVVVIGTMRDSWEPYLVPAAA